MSGYITYDLIIQHDIGVFVQDEASALTRPKVLYHVVSTIATLTVAYYNGTKEVPKLALKALYSAIANVVGVNVGLLMKADPWVDNAVAGGSYYIATNISKKLTLGAFNRNAGIEATVGAIAGYLANYFFVKRKERDDEENKDD